jgi:exosome complex component RRP41
MAYKRQSGRKPEEPRPIEAEVGVIKNADGSARFKIGDTEAFAAVYGPRELYPSFLKNPSSGILRCYYNMLPFSGMGDRVRPGPSRRSKEISLVTQSAFATVVNLEDFPNTVVDVYIELTETDAGSRCAGICAASMALAHAGIPMEDLVVAVSVGKVDKTILVDLDYSEEATDGVHVADMPIAVLPRTGELVLLQMDGQITKDEIMAAIKLGKKAIEKIYNTQKEALKASFVDGGDNDKRE